MDLQTAQNQWTSSQKNIKIMGIWSMILGALEVQVGLRLSFHDDGPTPPRTREQVSILYTSNKQLGRDAAHGFLRPRVTEGDRE